MPSTVNPRHSRRIERSSGFLDLHYKDASTNRVGESGRDIDTIASGYRNLMHGSQHGINVLILYPARQFRSFNVPVEAEIDHSAVDDELGFGFAMATLKMVGGKGMIMV